MTYDPNNPARQEWARRRAAQIDWMHTHPRQPSPDSMRTTVDDVRHAFGLVEPAA